MPRAEDRWMDKYPLTKKMEQTWEGCAWIEGMEDFHEEPLGTTPTLEILTEWQKETFERRKRVWTKAERYFEQNPEEYRRLLALGREYKQRGWLEYV